MTSRRQRVLVIDDSPEIHDVLAVRLRPEDIDLHSALTGEEGIARAIVLRPDLILLDIAMPALDGFEVCKRLKADPRTSALPVVFLTATDAVFSKVQAFDLGAIDYVTKPFDVVELRARVRAALRTKRYQDILAMRAQVDALTTLWNRAYFERRLADELVAAARYGRVVSLVMLDIDDFKAINDTHGHPVGDMVLERVGDALMSALRDVDAPCRYGGEEFACVLTETPLDGAMTLAERLRDRVRELGVTTDGRVLRVTASFGASSTQLFAPGEPVTPQAIVRSADGALYEAKRMGRDRVCRAERVADVARKDA